MLLQVYLHALKKMWAGNIFLPYLQYKEAKRVPLPLSSSAGKSWSI